MRYHFKMWKQKIEQELWIPAVRDLVHIAILQGYHDLEYEKFLKELEKEAQRRLQRIPF